MLLDNVAASLKSFIALGSSRYHYVIAISRLFEVPSIDLYIESQKKWKNKKTVLSNQSLAVPRRWIQEESSIHLEINNARPEQKKLSRKHLQICQRSSMQQSYSPPNYTRTTWTATFHWPCSKCFISITRTQVRFACATNTQGTCMVPAKNPAEPLRHAFWSAAVKTVPEQHALVQPLSREWTANHCIQFKYQISYMHNVCIYIWICYSHSFIQNKTIPPHPHPPNEEICLFDIKMPVDLGVSMAAKWPATLLLFKIRQDELEW